MPLTNDPKDFHTWIKELEQTRPRKQSIAIALDHLRKLKSGASKANPK